MPEDFTSSLHKTLTKAGIFVLEPFGRKQHNQGYKHKENVRKYYQQFEEQQTQSLIDEKIKEHLSGQVAFNQMAAYYAAWPPSARPPVFPPPTAPAYGTPALAPVYGGVSAATTQTNVPPGQPVVGPATYALGTTPNAAAVYAPQPMFQDMPRNRKH